VSVEAIRETMFNQFDPVHTVHVALFLRDLLPRCV